MRLLFHINLFLLFVLALVGCGGDEPVPSIPEEPQTDTTAIDTVSEDTTIEDEDSDFECVYIPYAELAPEGECKQEGARQYQYDKNGKLDYTCKKYDKYVVEARCEGYLSQRVYSQFIFYRTMFFDLQPPSTTGKRVEEIERSTSPTTLHNDEVNQSNTGITAEATFPVGCQVEGAESADTVSLVTFLPAACLVDDPEKGAPVLGAVAGVTLTPLGSYFTEGGNVCLTLPMDVEGYRFMARTIDGEETGAKVKGNQVSFDAFLGDEWTLNVEARITDVSVEQIYRAKEQSMPTRHNILVSKYYIAYAYAIPAGYGFEAETPLNFIEERMLYALYGGHGWYSSSYVCQANRNCTILYNVFQDVYHITFEAGGRQFKAKVYGDTWLEIVSATPIDNNS